MQYVGVEFRTSPGKVYDYQWDGEKPLKLGDRVVVPPNGWNPVPSFGSVIRLCSDRSQVNYKGQLATIMGVVGEEA